MNSPELERTAGLSARTTSAFILFATMASLCWGCAESTIQDTTVIDGQRSAGEDAALRASIEIDLSDIVREVPRALFGANVEWIFEGQGIWSTGGGRIEPQVTRLGGELGVSLLRFPGGVFSDYYHWRDGVGPQSRRPTSEHFPGGPPSRHSFGTDEVSDLALQIGAQLLLTVNAGTGTPEEAADWVRYMESNAKANVAYWEVGNELYIEGDLSGAHMPPEDYADKYGEFAAAMREADPNIELGAIGGLNYGNYRFIADDDWTETVLERNADDIDYLSVHNAYAPIVIGVSERTDPYDVYRALMAAPLHIEQNIQDLSELLERYEPQGKTIDLAITEWGPFFHVSPDNPWVDHVKTLGSALYVASALNTFLRNPRVAIATFFKLTDNGFMGWIGNRDERFVVTAPYLAFKLYSENAGDYVVRTQLRSPSFDTNAVGAVPATQDVPYLDAIATVGDERTSVLVVNRHFSDPIEATISIDGLRGLGRVVKTTLTGTAVDAHTGSELPQVPGLAWAPQVVLERFDRGSEDEILTRVEELSALAGVSDGTMSLEVEFAPHSITCLVFENSGPAF